MSKRGWVYAIPLMMVACQKSPSPFENEPQPEYQQPGQPGTDGGPGTYGPGTEGQPGTDGQMGEREGQFGQQGRGGRNLANAPQAVQNFHQYVQQLRSASTVEYTDLSQALRNLSDAFQALPADNAKVADAVSRIDSYADRIEAAGATSNMHTRWAQRALMEGVDALEAYEKDQGLTDTEGIEGLRSQLEQINPEQPFTQQKDAFVNAMDRISGMLVQVSSPRQEPGTR